MKYLGHIINGDVFSESKRTLSVFNPATAQQTADVELASQVIVDEAVIAAQNAMKSWQLTPINHRAKIMFRMKVLIEQNADKICNMLTEEHGKVIDDARGELARGIENIDFACGIAQLLKGEHNSNISTNIDSWSEFKPLGVVVGITPFNFPAMVPLWMWPIAIMCGNTFVLKPSEQAPSAPFFICELAQQAGLPAGVLNLVNGDKIASELLINDPCVKAVSFVGSTPVAKSIYQQAALNNMRCQALGGAKNHAVVMPDADIDFVANSLMGAAFGSCGERCMAISVAVVIGDECADLLVQSLKQRIDGLKVGSGFDTQNEMGPLISKVHKERVEKHIESGIEQGAKLVSDGRQLFVEGFESGYFLGGTVFDHVTSDMDIYQQEIFGPVLCVMRVKNLEAALALVNKHQYGNGTCIFTQNGSAAHYFSENVAAGMVGINVPLPVPMSCHSFGGWKQSIFGDLNAYGPDAVRFYTQRKTITSRWKIPSQDHSAQFSFPS
ncbi:CoA-acylating methylmalonate-semialdehyde dehydrogenase [Parashewanella spongiae]|uniref:methylmalonate-semialdehyde dehydrogenase (CoA acylating) n=1 Tax=Parashewanella spongiae TaxID=342950 RepID=A0A3A6T9C0_9GAMM|nr:CoA-acylating methylmalonate-semialdehyde dehydrogenase [Parashewanella spongiae]MCL1080061.1 CoA-acylating methylmalonate-semialdehyde dehydrogenase [Parashewanella spongiae]RJY05981.1 CoA-acylating methylmalonate-semialdehyde dehydrogenase [Parashewanella spongiae]